MILKSDIKNKLFFFALVIISVSLLLLYLKFNTNGYLLFSDSAKFADIARNLVQGKGYGDSFNFWSPVNFIQIRSATFTAPWVPPLMPLSIALAFKLFGVSDLSVIYTSSFYFILLVIFTFLLGRKLFGNLVGVLSAIAVASSLDFLSYAATGASEPLFTLEIVSSIFFISFRKRWATVVGLILTLSLYFTRPFGFIYIAGIILYWLILNFKTKKALALFIFVSFLGFLVDHLVLTKFAGKLFLYSVTERGVSTAIQVQSGGSPSDSLRGVVVASHGVLPIIKKLFYNLYNYYKLLPQILSPYLAGLFILSVFKSNKNKFINSFKIFTVFISLTTLIVSSASIPFIRYIHPIVPFIYLLAVAGVVEFFNVTIENRKLTIIASTFAVLLFITGQTLGVIFLDSRFDRSTHNIGKPPVYSVLSNILRENTSAGMVTITNLDTWGSWYGERRTIWYPVEPKQIIDSSSGKIPFDAIYLTSYLISDQNYLMGGSWHQIFDNPKDPEKWKCDGCREISKEFEVKGVYSINSESVYENQKASAVLLVKKQ